MQVIITHFKDRCKCISCCNVWRKMPVTASDSTKKRTA
nr:MAG TPA: hypothetical protein [Caudoviricetes sp.]